MVVSSFLQEGHDSNKVSAESAAVCRFVAFITMCSAFWTGWTLAHFERPCPEAKAYSDTVVLVKD